MQKMLSGAARIFISISSEHENAITKEEIFLMDRFELVCVCVWTVSKKIAWTSFFRKHSETHLDYNSDYYFMRAISFFGPYFLFSSFVSKLVCSHMHENKEWFFLSWKYEKCWK